MNIRCYRVIKIKSELQRDRELGSRRTWEKKIEEERGMETGERKKEIKRGRGVIKSFSLFSAYFCIWVYFP
jgi:hypothetical protein